VVIDLNCVISQGSIVGLLLKEIYGFPLFNLLKLTTGQTKLANVYKKVKTALHAIRFYKRLHYLARTQTNNELKFLFNFIL
jgi:hypothetical protein